MNRGLKYIAFLLLLPIIFAGCGPSPKFTASQKQEEKNDNTETKIRYKNIPEVYLNDSVFGDDFQPLETVTGTASYYADEFNEKITYNGEVYDMNGLTAAHPTYPMETMIRVTNLLNNRSVILRINDRMPQYPDRIIDLSLGAAIELDMVEIGLAEVMIEVIEWGIE
ncbi:MAG: septal ring lytic transglycosylase RlpA family protein [Melioribacteraceae bacterium]|nr:septal ring lytic transglycosylase RlpA family protein [Melioribacteraceae bacterium]